MMFLYLIVNNSVKSQIPIFRPLDGGFRRIGLCTGCLLYTSIHTECTLAVRLEISDGVAGIGKPSLTFEFTPYFHRLAFHNTCGDRQGLHLERIGLLYIHFIIAGGQQTSHQTQEMCIRDRNKDSLTLN